MGAPRAAATWTQLNVTAESGTDEIVLPVGWYAAAARFCLDPARLCLDAPPPPRRYEAAGIRKGDRLLIAPSGLDWDEREVVEVGGVAERSDPASGFVTLWLTTALKHEHRGLENTNVFENAQPWMAAEVAIVGTSTSGGSRYLNVIVEGVDGTVGDDVGSIGVQHFGVALYIMRRDSQCPGRAGAPVEGRATIQGAEQRVRRSGWRNNCAEATLTPHPATNPDTDHGP